MEDYLIHYRTPGSKNGVRKYQNKDGSYTELGKLHYGIGLKNRNVYYDPNYKPKFFDSYGKEKQKELNEFKKEVGNKNYKGLERAEMQDTYKKVSSGWNKKKWKKGIEESIRREHEQKQIEEEQRKNQTSDDIITNNVNKPIAALANTDAQTAINYLNDTSDFLNSPIEFLLKKYVFKKG